MTRSNKEYTYFKARGHKNGQPHRSPSRQAIKKILEDLIRSGGLSVEEPPTHASIELKPGGFYKSRDGRKIQIWAINKDSVDKPVLGMILTGEEWETRYFNEQGVCKRPYGAGNDIVAEWSES